MAGFRTHVTVSGVLGIVYGGVAVQPLGYSTEAGLLAAAITGVGGMLPDLDSDYGVPIREMFSLAAVVLPLMLIHRLRHAGLSPEGLLAVLLFGYIVIRYGAAQILRRLSVHRGMFHSIPAMFIAGLCVYLAYFSDDRSLRVLFGCGVMIGFLSHLILDEVYSVDWRGMKPRLKSSAGTAFKFGSSSVPATATCYLILGGLLYLLYLDMQKTGGDWGFLNKGK